MVSSIFFYVFASILIVSCLKVITAKNPVHAVLFMVLAFVTSSCLWIMLNVEFLALTLILVYVGAVMVLFLFVVMMLDIDVEVLRQGFWKNLPLALLLGVIALVEMLMVLIRKPDLYVVEKADSSMNNANHLGYVLYTEYPYPVELASLLLLLGLVAAVTLTLRQTSKNAKYQNIAKQVAVKSVDRVELVKMEASVIKEDIPENKEV